MKEDKTDPKNQQKEQSNADANKCIGIGAGVGALGVGATALTGLSCPVCWVAAPALIGIGVIKKMQNKKNETK